MGVVWNPPVFNQISMVRGMVNATGGGGEEVKGNSWERTKVCQRIWG